MKATTPPPARASARSQHWAEVVAWLNSHKGEWALVGNYSPGVATHIRKGKYPAFVGAGAPDPEKYVRTHYEVTSRVTPDGRNDIYIRAIK